MRNKPKRITLWGWKLYFGQSVPLDKWVEAGYKRSYLYGMAFGDWFFGFLTYRKENG